MTQAGSEKHGGAIRSALGRAGRTLLSQRVRPVWLLAAAMLVLFGAFRGALLIASRASLHSVGPGAIFRCFLVGLRYDAVPLGYALIPLVLALSLAPDAAFARRLFRGAVSAYCAALITLVLLVEIVGVGFFLQFGARLNWLALDYLEHFHEAAAYICDVYPVWIMPLAAVGGLVGFYALFRWLFWRGRRPRGPIWTRPVAAAVLTGCCVLMARGSLSHHPLRMGPAYFCDNEIVNQLAFNNIFTFAEAVDSYLADERTLAAKYPFPPDDQAWDVACKMLVQEADSPGAEGRNRLWRRTDTARPRQDCNVVLIIMEGMGGQPVGALGYQPSHTPRLDALCRQGLLLGQMYATDERTSRGLAGILCGHPDLGGKSLIKRSRAQGNFLTLPDIFRRRGYRTLFVYGGDPDFDNMQGFFGAGGVERFVGLKQMDAKDLTGHWGAHDEVVYRKAHEVFAGLGEQKFFAVVLTVSNHEPFDVPAGRTELLPASSLENKRLNAYRYADWALGQFFELASKAPYFRHTLFVLVSDTGRKFDHGRLFDVPGYRVPCLFYAPDIVPPGRIDAVASQTDIAPTLLALLGGAYEHCFMGRNLLAVQAEEGFAFLRDDDRLAFVDGRDVLVLPPEREPVLFIRDPLRMVHVPPEQIDRQRVQQLQLRMLSYYKVARHMYFEGIYRRPE